MEYKNLLYEVKEKIAYITINRPDVLNALNPELMEELYDVFSVADKDPAVKCIIITGAGRAFVAGADISSMQTMSYIESRKMQQQGHDLMNHIEKVEKPVIAAVNGYALGGGNELAMACDIRVASTKAKFGNPEINLGWIPAMGGTQRLPHLVGKGFAKYMIYSGEHIRAEEAYRLGLADFLVEPEELMPKCEEIARKFCKKSLLALAAAKVAINNGYYQHPFVGGNIEIEAFTLPFAAEDRHEGINAFYEKREPDFKDR